MRRTMQPESGRKLQTGFRGFLFACQPLFDGAEAYLSQDSREVNANLSERVTFAEASMKAVQSKTLCWKENALTAVVRT